MEAQPLSDVRVIDLTHGIAGPYCTKLLADHGADVIKIERPDTGDFTRQLGPFPHDVPNPEKSGIFLHLNTNKRSVVLNLKTPQGVEILKGLTAGADILIESFRPGTLAKLELDDMTLTQINPHLVITSLSNFGQTGPYRDYHASELVLYAMGGSMNTTGLADRPPLKLGGNHVQYQAGTVAAMATLFALYGRQYQNMGGQHVDISIFETQMASYNRRMPTLLQHQYTGKRGRREELGAGVLGYPGGFYPCKDGYITVTGGGAFWPRTVAMLGIPELLSDPRFAPPMGQLSPEGREEFEATFWLPWLMDRTKREVVEECQAHQILSGALNTICEVVDDNPQFEARGYWVDIAHPVAGTLCYPGAPIFTQEGWWRLRRPAPLLGQYTEEVLRDELGYSQEGLSRLRVDGVIL